MKSERCAWSPSFGSAQDKFRTPDRLSFHISNKGRGPERSILNGDSDSEAEAIR